MAIGRPSTLTPAITKALCEHLAEGAYAESACNLEGLAEGTYYRWLAMGENEATHPEHAAFREAVKKASAIAERDALREVRIGVQQWQSRAWFLERRFPKRWGRQATVEVERVDDSWLDGEPSSLEEGKK